MKQNNFEQMLLKMKKICNDKQAQIKQSNNKKLKIRDKKHKMVKKTESKYDPL